MSGKTKKYYLITEMDAKTFEHLRYHFFSNDIKNGWYRGAMTYNAFFNSGKDRNKSKTRLFHADSFLSGLTPYVRERIAKGEATVVEHETIWDFYKAIGYDYKSKKYIN